ncbi:M99 family carboxypeptidase catalytic domain-containing protein [Paenibacillus kobensis]|uniref:M99 family carboxypeptidase catalytic domain-containing protein n=1 Tax=Paenibacillus kobensis TaxID=59841 RepID=UPI000FD83E7D|nr:succinylglutamate desuccinylase/aspartoacylase family protein [Paenibacillus kobensis]
MSIQKRLLAKGSAYESPYYVIKGEQKGPVCMITAGIHGREKAGILAAQKFQNIRLKRGTLILVPIVNKKAYLLNRRGFPGCPDLNRTFPYKTDRRPRHQLADQLLHLARTFRPDLTLDLHEANGFYKKDKSKLGQTIINIPKSPTVTSSKKVAARINKMIDNSVHHFSVAQNVVPRSFRLAMARSLGCKAITIETSMSLRLKTRIKYHEEIVKMFLKEMGLIDKNIKHLVEIIQPSPRD